MLPMLTLFPCPSSRRAFSLRPKSKQHSVASHENAAGGAVRLHLFLAVLADQFLGTSRPPWRMLCAVKTSKRLHAWRLLLRRVSEKPTPATMGLPFQQVRAGFQIPAYIGLS